MILQKENKYYIIKLNHRLLNKNLNKINTCDLKILKDRLAAKKKLIQSAAVKKWTNIALISNSPSRTDALAIADRNDFFFILQLASEWVCALLRHATVCVSDVSGVNRRRMSTVYVCLM